MKRRPWWNPTLSAVSICIVLLVIHTLLRLVLAEYDVVSTIFAAGDHVPIWMLLCASLFVVIRLCVLLLIPALLAWSISTSVVKRLNRA